MPNNLNILMILVDQWRWDCLGSAGHPVIQTPHLDILAEEGNRFSSAYAAVPSCIAARTSLMTGLHHRKHGRVGYKDAIPWNYSTTLGNVFTNAGYHTQVVGKMHVFPARNLLGFHNVVLHDGYLHWNRQRQPMLVADDDYLLDLRRHHGVDADYIDSGIGCNGYAVTPWPYDLMLHPTAWVTSQSIDFLRRRDPTRPFFLISSYHRPHPPLDPPQAYLDLYRESEIPKPISGDWVGEDGLPNSKNRKNFTDSPKHINESQIQQARRAYYAQCTFIDHQINRIIMALIEQQVFENTLILFMSDHGDMLFDHEVEAKSLPYQGSAGIPLIIRTPDHMNLPKNQIITEPVELRDILPTLCDLSGIPIPSDISGQSLLPLLQGKITPWREYLHGEHESGEWSNHWITDGKMKYIWYSQTGREQLFNLQDDPLEIKDLAASEPQTILIWRSRLIRELEGREEGYVSDGKLVLHRMPTPILKEAGLKP